mmetsp:Transcript_27877/g.68547  ORF Transcript_27877/g.68547 Transcript_27877/m.68547 type:complete len:201 (+) Transcript_27877:2209-2811(+)
MQNFSPLGSTGGAWDSCSSTMAWPSAAHSCAAVLPEEREAATPATNAGCAARALNHTTVTGWSAAGPPGTPPSASTGYRAHHTTTSASVTGTAVVVSPPAMLVAPPDSCVSMVGARSAARAPQSLDAHATATAGARTFASHSVHRSVAQRAAPLAGINAPPVPPLRYRAMALASLSAIALGSSTSCQGLTLVRLFPISVT